MLFCYGPGSLDLRRRVQTYLQDAIALTPEIGPSVSLRVVNAYKHVGTRMVGSDAMLPRIYTRFAQMSATEQPLVNKVFRRLPIPMKTRMTLARTLLYSKCFFQACVLVFIARG